MVPAALCTAAIHAITCQVHICKHTYYEPYPTFLFTYHAPRQHHDRYPFARTDFLEHKIRRYLKEDLKNPEWISMNEENSSAIQPECAIGNDSFHLHSQ